MHLISLSCIFAFLILNVNCQCDPNITDYVNFMFFTGPSVQNYELFSYSNATSILKEPKFDVALPTIFVFHGWTENTLLLEPNESSVVIITPLLKKKVNTIAVTYGPLLQVWPNETHVYPINLAVSYNLAVANLTCMISPMQELFNVFFSQCSCYHSSQFVGFSLGGQMSGLIGKELNRKLHRIVGLDPAGPLFDNIPHLEPTDAKFVEVIHTNAGGFGFPKSCGQVDFWPNNGTKQPGCPETDNLCSHTSAARYFANSIANRTAYPVGWLETMGYYTTPLASGNIYFET